MKNSIIVAIVSVSIMVAARIIMGGLALLSGEVSILRILFPVLVAVLILVGIIKRQRLAWQWGRLLGLVGAIILTFAAVGAFINYADQPGILIFAILIALQGIPLFPMFFALGTQQAKEYFHIICPECGNTKVRGGNFFYTKVICRKCNASWS